MDRLSIDIARDAYIVLAMYSIYSFEEIIRMDAFLMCEFLFEFNRTTNDRAPSIMDHSNWAYTTSRNWFYTVDSLSIFFSPICHESNWFLSSIGICHFFKPLRLSFCGTQNVTLDAAVCIIKKYGLNSTAVIASGCLERSTATCRPLDWFHICTLPSELPDRMYSAFGEKVASSGMPRLLLRSVGERKELEKEIPA